VRFKHPRGLLPLPLPERGGSLNALRDLANVESDSEWRLLLGALLAAFRATGPYPVLILTGEQGAAKSTTARLLRSLIDPNAAPLRSEPRDGRDLVIAANNGWLLALDNLSYLPPWLSDCLCRPATGGGFATRELYTDSDEVLFDSQRPVILTSIEDIADRGDLLDRAVIVRLPAIPEEKRRRESEFWAAADAARPAILGALLDVVSAGLRNLPSVQLDRLPRMADFAAWVTACEPALGWTAGSFLTAYTGNRADANELARLAGGGQGRPVVRKRTRVSGRFCWKTRLSPYSPVQQFAHGESARLPKVGQVASSFEHRTSSLDGSTGRTTKVCPSGRQRCCDSAEFRV